MQGLHLTADLHGCRATSTVMTDADSLRRCCLGAVQRAGLQAVGVLFHRFAPAPHPPRQAPGITGVVLLAESHLAVHTWPELGAVTLDVYVCNFGADNSQRAEQLLSALIEAFAPTACSRQALRRGNADGTTFA
ncbi:MAG: adenosylmethionine decarboxylase [Rhizobacter sp.]|nr:adenosylmethionine decarboxylase [Rhizobacter sp.]